MVPGVDRLSGDTNAGSVAEHCRVRRARAAALGETWARNTLRGPGLTQIDLALQKRFAISGSRNFEFRWEMFNAFNRMNLGNPATNISSPAQFGRITGPLNSGYGTGTARQMQMMLRMNF